MPSKSKKADPVDIAKALSNMESPSVLLTALESKKPAPKQEGE